MNAAQDSGVSPPAYEMETSSIAEPSSGGHSASNDITTEAGMQVATDSSMELVKQPLVADVLGTIYFFGLASFFKNWSKFTLSSQTISVMFQLGLN